VRGDVVRDVELLSGWDRPATEGRLGDAVPRVVPALLGVKVVDVVDADGVDPNSDLREIGLQEERDLLPVAQLDVHVINRIRIAAWELPARLVDLLSRQVPAV